MTVKNVPILDSGLSAIVVGKVRELIWSGLVRRLLRRIRCTTAHSSGRRRTRYAGHYSRGPPGPVRACSPLVLSATPPTIEKAIMTRVRDNMLGAYFGRTSSLDGRLLSASAVPCRGRGADRTPTEWLTSPATCTDQQLLVVFMCRSVQRESTDGRAEDRTAGQ